MTLLLVVVLLEENINRKLASEQRSKTIVGIFAIQENRETAMEISSIPTQKAFLFPCFSNQTHSVAKIENNRWDIMI